MVINSIIEVGEKYNNTDRMIIKDNIRVILKKHRGNRNQLAEEIGISKHTLDSYTNIKGNAPDFVTALKLSEVLNVNINELIK